MPYSVVDDAMISGEKDWNGVLAHMTVTFNSFCDSACL